MIHVVDGTGNIIAQLTEGSDTSWYEAQGYKTITGAKELADISEWRYEDGELKPVSDAERLERARREKIKELKRTADTFVLIKPDGSDRYPPNLRDNLTKAAMRAVAAGQPIPDAIVAVMDWTDTVTAAYYERRSLLEAATTFDELNAVDISYDWFEARYGVNGSVLPDPDIYTRNIINV